MARFYATCTLGLEEVLVDELHGVAASKIRAKRGGANSTAAADAEDCKGSPAWLTKPDAQV